MFSTTHPPIMRQNPDAVVWTYKAPYTKRIKLPACTNARYQQLFTSSVPPTPRRKMVLTETAIMKNHLPEEIILIVRPRSRQKFFCPVLGWTVTEVLFCCASYVLRKPFLSAAQNRVSLPRVFCPKKIERRRQREHLLSSLLSSASRDSHLCIRRNLVHIYVKSQTQERQYRLNATRQLSKAFCRNRFLWCSQLLKDVDGCHCAWSTTIHSSAFIALHSYVWLTEIEVQQGCWRQIRFHEQNLSKINRIEPETPDILRTNCSVQTICPAGRRGSKLYVQQWSTSGAAFGHW